MSANVEAMVREGISAAKSGKREEARVLLTKAVELDPYHEEGWLWLSGVLDAPDDQRTCLENVLAINPSNDKARKGLDYLTKGPPPPPPPPQVRNPFNQPPTEPPVVETARPTVTSVEWDFGAAEPPSAPPARPVAEPSPKEYDDWVSGLQLKTAEPGKAASPFVSFEDDFFADKPFADDAPADADPTFTMPPASAPPPPRAPSALPTIAYRPPPVEEPVRTPAPAAGAPDDADVFARMSPTEDDGKSVNPFAMPTAASRTRSPAPPAEDDFVMSSNMFPSIPKAVPPTRLPGTKERVPFVYVLLALVLFVANTLVAMLLVNSLLTPA